MLLDAAVCCRTGTRGRNQDNYYLNGLTRPDGPVRGALLRSAQVDAAAALYGVCDGMGGMSSGETASRLATDILRTGMEEILAAPDASKVLKRWMKRMHRAVLGQAEDAGRRMGAAGVIARIAGNEVTVCNVGDCRAYLLHGGEFRQLSQDDTLERDFGGIMHSPRHNGSLTQYLGMEEEEFSLSPHIFCTPFPLGAKLLLCSDGVGKYWTPSDLKQLLATGSAQESVSRLAEGPEGELDDITALVVVCL